MTNEELIRVTTDFIWELAPRDAGIFRTQPFALAGGFLAFGIELEGEGSPKTSVFVPENADRETAKMSVASAWEMFSTMKKARKALRFEVKVPFVDVGPNVEIYLHPGLCLKAYVDQVGIPVTSDSDGFVLRIVGT